MAKSREQQAVDSFVQRLARGRAATLADDVLASPGDGAAPLVAPEEAALERRLPELLAESSRLFGEMTAAGCSLIRQNGAG
jgi:hypothetical protein